jgi:hypothetical protein
MKTIKVMRLLIYEGEEEWVLKTLDKSLAEAKHEVSIYGTVTVIELKDPTITITYQGEYGQPDQNNKRQR